MSMRVNIDSREAVRVARQPILDRSDKVIGYELLYCDDAPASARLTSDEVAATRVITDALLAIGLDTLTAGLPAFLSVTRRVLVGCAGMLPPAATVLELPATVEVDDELIEACRSLKEEGYALALDGVTANADVERLLPYVQFVKVDVRRTSAGDREAIARQLAPRGLQLIAKNVDTASVAKQVRAAGYALVQGFFFCKAETFSAKTVPARHLAYVELLAALNRPHLSVGELEDLVKHDASMSYRVLRCVNSAAFGAYQEVTSIRHAIMLLGFDQIRKWASTWAVAGANQSGTQELAVVAILRARCCELLGDSLLDEEMGGEFFLLGLCSLLDVILCQPLDKALASLPLSAGIRHALVGGPGFGRSVLDAVMAYERGAWDEAADALKTTGLDPAILPAVYHSALEWTRELLRPQMAA